MKELVSVIIPVYNVETYLDSCMESVAGQTYRNLEIILVDDGSTDGSKELCDQWGKKDARVQVLHKPNGGLSDARNHGMEIATGRYITFIDSDDRISRSFVEEIVAHMQQSDAQIGIAAMKTVGDSNGADVVQGNTRLVMDTEEVLEDMLYEKHTNTSACGKVFERALFDGITFPVGKLYEDLATIYRVFLKADKISYSDAACYFYYQRPGSIIHSPLNKRHLDLFDAWNCIYRDVVVESQELMRSFYSKKLDGIIGLLLKDTKACGLNGKAIWNEIRSCRRIVLFDRKAKLRIRLEALLSFFGRRICMGVIRQYYKKR